MPASDTTPVTFRDLIAANKRNSVLLVMVFCLFTAAVILVIGLAVAAYLIPGAISAMNWTSGLVAGGIALSMALLVAWLGYMRGDQMVLGVSHARPIEHADDPELFNVVSEMAIAAGIPMPEVYLIDDPAPNACATGRDPQHAIVAVTSGLRSKLSRDELQGVVAHEVSHIRNFDIRLMLLLAVLVGTIVMLSDFLWQVLRFGYWTGGGIRGERRRSRDSGAWLTLVLLVLAVILALIAPILAQIIQLAVSRQREYLADASAVELTRYPQGLANALRKIAADPNVLQHANRGTAHLFIANPIKKFEALGSTMFASHPPLEDRIRRLEALVH